MKKIEANIKTFDGLQLNAKVHEVGAPIWIIVVHGLGEHQQRHDHLFSLLGEDFNILTFDLRGHGLSDGAKADVLDFNHYIQDLNSVVKFLKKDYNLDQYLILGHSMGGLITARYIQSDYEDMPEGVFLSSPAIGSTGVASKILKFLPDGIIKSLANFNKGVYLKGILDLKKLSHNYLIYKNYIKDPLCSLKVNSRLLLKVLEAGLEALGQASPVKCKVYGAIGSGDALVAVDSTVNFFKKLNREDHLKIYKGGFHELHNEIPEYRDRYLDYLKKTFLSFRYNENS